MELTTNRIPKIGGRVWKTGVAVALSLAICRVLNIPEPVFAGVAAVIVMQPTVLQTFRKGLERLQATVVGAAVALGMLALVTLFPYPYIRPIAAGMAVIMVLWLCLALRWLDALVLAAATVVVVMIQSEERPDIFVYALERTLVTAIGIVVASVVNAFMFWPKVEDRFPKRLPEIAGQAFREFEWAVLAFCRRDLDAARSALDAWQEHKPSFDTAVAELAWFQDSVAVKQMLPFYRAQLAPALTDIYSIIDSAHQAACRLLEDTISILEERPDYVVQDAYVYHIVEEALKPASELAHAVVEALETGDLARLRESEHEWTDQLHRQFVRAIRAAHRSPRDLFPLFEVAKTGVELRNYTRQLVRLRDILLQNEQALQVLRRQR